MDTKKIEEFYNKNKIICFMLGALLLYKLSYVVGAGIANIYNLINKGI